MGSDAVPIPPVDNEIISTELVYHNNFPNGGYERKNLATTNTGNIIRKLTYRFAPI